MTPSAIGWSLHMGGEVGEGGRILGEGGADCTVQCTLSIVHTFI